MKYISKSLEETQKIAYDFMVGGGFKEGRGGATVIGLYGDLGSGKTAFAQAVAKAMGVSENIASPTFVIEKVYELDLRGRPFFHLIHIDAYRLDSSDELLQLGWKKITSRGTNLIVVEWPEKVADIMPEHIKIYLKSLENENSREIEIML